MPIILDHLSCDVCLLHPARHYVMVTPVSDDAAPSIKGFICSECMKKNLNNPFYEVAIMSRSAFNLMPPNPNGNYRN